APPPRPAAVGRGRSVVGRSARGQPQGLRARSSGRTDRAAQPRDPPWRSGQRDESRGTAAPGPERQPGAGPRKLAHPGDLARTEPWPAAPGAMERGRTFDAPGFDAGPEGLAGGEP